MNYLIIGSGGREHTIFWRLSTDGSADKVYCAPGNGGIPTELRVPISQNDFNEIANFCKSQKIDLVIVGPEAPLSEGIVDYLETQNIKAFGPNSKAAQLESSKLFAKQIMEKYGIPTAKHEDFLGKTEILKFIESNTEYPIVIKLDGLAAGKGVAIPASKEEAINFINENVTDNTPVFVEEFLDGEEASVLGISDGTSIKCFVSAQDHKRVFDGDKGPNTGGMGAYAPAPIVTEAILKQVQDEILQKTIDGMNKENIPFKGILYAGLMIKDNKIKVLEFNVRFGDPEAQVILPLLNGKLGDLFLASVNSKIAETDISFSKRNAITVVMASQGYPGPYDKNIDINLQSIDDKDVIVFHAGTEIKDGKLVTTGGRVLNITGLGNSLTEAREKVYSAIDNISFKGSFYRKDIGHRALKTD